MTPRKRAGAAAKTATGGDTGGSLRVAKFGGAALADAGGMRRVAAIVRAARGPRIVVASAMMGVTDLLQAAVAEGAAIESDVVPMLEALRNRHEEALRVVARDGDEAAAYALRTTLERLERLLYGIAYTQETTPRLHDLVLSFGERLAAPVLAAALRAAGAKAVHFDAEDAGVRSLGPFGNARPDMDAMRKEAAHLRTRATGGEVPVVTGFFGVDADGNTTLFGRGGSDYVAALLAAALDAEALELWKDVPGFLSADPRAVPAARLVPLLGYDEAAELAHVGAKVLHPRAVEPVQEAAIPIHIRDFARPDEPGSVLRGDVPDAASLVRSIASRDGLAILRLNGPGMAYTPGVAKKVFDRLADARINILNMSTSQATFALLLLSEDAAPARQALEPLIGGTIQGVEVFTGRSLVCVVGRGLGETPGSAARILQAVGDAGVNIEMISLGASDIAIDFIVRADVRPRAVRAIHKTFLESLP